MKTWLSIRRPLCAPASRLVRRLKNVLLYNGSYGLNGLDKSIIRILKPRRASGYYVELGANDGFRQSKTYLLESKYHWKGLLIEPSRVKYVQCVKNRSFGSAPSFHCAACVDSSYGQRFVEMQYSDLMSVAYGLQLNRQEATRHAEIGTQFLECPNMCHSFGAIARTLTSLLEEVDAPWNFDFLSLDVEGNELAVLRGLDFTLYRPK